MPFLSAILLTMATPVLAQVTVDLHALQALPNNVPASHVSRPAPMVVQRSPAVVTSREAPAVRQPAPSPAQPAMPENAPDTAIIASLPPASSQPGAQPPPPPVPDKAVIAAAPRLAALRLVFAPGQSDLNPESATSIKQLTASTPTSDATTFNVLAYAPGKADDPSTARRVSLSRAMAVRSALVADGVPSARIFVRALGEQYGDGPPDRVDLSVTGADTAAAR